MATITAQQILDENNYAISDISLANLEYLINNAINYVNLEAGTSISNLSGSPGSVTVTNDQSIVVKALTVLLLRAYLDRGPNASVSGLTVSSLLADPQYDLFTKLAMQGVNRLRGRSFKTT